MEYLKPSEIAKKWQVSVTIVRRYCTEGRIEGAEFNGETWLIPENAIPAEGEVRFNARSKQRCIATARYFAAGMMPSKS